MLKKPHRFRVILLGMLFCCFLTAVCVRLYGLQYVQHEYFQERATRQHTRRVVIQPERGDILDRNGAVLAQSTGRMTLYIHPKYFKHPHSSANLDQLAGFIADLTGGERATVRRRFDAQSPVAIAKRVRPELAESIVDRFDSLEIDGRGHWLQRESIRLYPRGVASSVVGFCSTDGDGDNIGLAGVEYSYNEQLKGAKIVGTARRTASSQTIEPLQPEELLAARGNTLVLTLDAKLQEVAERTLEQTVREFQAKHAGAVVLDATTGAVLAMAHYPTFDNNAFSKAPPEHRRNVTLTDPLETGSVAKLYMAAILIDQGIISPETLIDCEGGFAVVDGRRLRDSPGHYLNVVPFKEAMRWSSNIGIVKAAQPLDNETWFRYLKALNFGDKTGIDLPGEGEGILYSLKRWTRLSRTSLPMGYEIALTPIQIAAAISAISNGGNYFRPYIVEEVRDARGNVLHRHQPEPSHRVIRPTTSAILRDLMEDVVANGTGKKAQVEGYRVGGKTGTTRKSNIFDRREYIASFAGVLPINAPKATIYLYIDAPETAYYASTVAAPAFQEIARAVALHLGIPPCEPEAEVGMIALGVDGIPAELPRAAAIYSSSMPDLVGLSMAESASRLPRDVTRVKMLGTGLVEDQFPPAGAPIGAQTEVVLHFSPKAVPPGTPVETAINVASKAGAAR